MYVEKSRKSRNKFQKKRKALEIMLTKIIFGQQILARHPSPFPVHQTPISQAQHHNQLHTEQRRNLRGCARGDRLMPRSDLRTQLHSGAQTDDMCCVNTMRFQSMRFQSIQSIFQSEIKQLQCQKMKVIILSLKLEWPVH